jgi:hypothetical protein
MGIAQGISLSEKKHALTFLISEDSDGGYLSRDQVTIGAGQDLQPGQVLGLKVATTVTAAAVANSGNTGNGTLTLATPAVASAVKGGNYKVIFDAATAFTVEGPEGKIVGKGAVGTAFAKEVLFTIAAGGAAFVAGDGFTINVDETINSEIYVAWDPAATDGSQVAKAILAYPVQTAAGVTAQATVINGHAVVRLADLTFKSGATAAQIDQARRELAAHLIKFR